MDIQKPIDYWQMFKDLMDRRVILIRQRDEAEVELSKIKQLILSVFSMLPEDHQTANQQAIDDMEAESSGLQDAIKLVFSTNQDVWLTASDVRDRLIDTGFDFRRYKANPLASIGTTLKRIADTNYIESNSTGSGTLYMRRAPIYNSLAARLRKFEIPKTGMPAPPGPDHPLRKLAQKPDEHQKR
jgi:hypothetical protein